MLNIRVRKCVWKEEVRARLWCGFDGCMLLSLFLRAFLPEWAEEEEEEGK